MSKALKVIAIGAALAAVVLFVRAWSSTGDFRYDAWAWFYLPGAVALTLVAAALYGGTLLRRRHGTFARWVGAGLITFGLVTIALLVVMLSLLGALAIAFSGY